MLTREESQKLYQALVGLTLMPEEIKDRIEIFTEKREIKVGDIYKDGHRVGREIIGICDGEEYPLKTPNLLSFTIDGIYDKGDPSSINNLDLTKRYKLIEITGEQK